MFILKKLYLYNRIEKATEKELKLQKQLNGLVEKIDQEFDKEGRFRLAEVKDILRAASLEGKDVDWYWRELNKVTDDLNSTRKKKKDLYFKLMGKNLTTT